MVRVQSLRVLQLGEREGPWDRIIRSLGPTTNSGRYARSRHSADEATVAEMGCSSPTLLAEASATRRVPLTNSCYQPV